MNHRLLFTGWPIKFKHPGCIIYSKIHSSAPWSQICTVTTCAGWEASLYSELPFLPVLSLTPALTVSPLLCSHQHLNMSPFQPLKFPFSCSFSALVHSKVFLSSPSVTSFLYPFQLITLLYVSFSSPLDVHHSTLLLLRFQIPADTWSSHSHCWVSSFPPAAYTVPLLHFKVKCL